MKYFNNLKLIYKTIAPLILLLAFMIPIFVMVLNKMMLIDQTYGNILKNDVDAAIVLYEGNSQLNRYSTVAYRIVSEISMDALENLEEEGKATHKTLVSHFTKITKKFPQFKAQLTKASSEIEVAAKGIEQVILQNFSNRQDKAKEIASNQVEPSIVNAQKILGTILNRVTKGVETSSLAASQEVKEALTYTIVSASAGVAVALVLAMMVLQFGVARPIMRMSRIMKKIAGGALEIPVDSKGRTDEVGLMADAVEVFRLNGLKMRELQEAEKLQEERMQNAKKETFQKLAGSFENTVKAVVQTVYKTASRLEKQSSTMIQSAELMGKQVAVMQKETETSTQSFQSVSSATEELSSSIKSILSQVNMASERSGDTARQGHKSNEVISELVEKTNKIGDIISLINDISGQTNLLALNATIEAVRAGDAGKGFSVVASEVKSLATQTGKATEEVASQVAQINISTEQAVEAINQILQSIEHVQESSNQVTSSVEQQGSATQEIAQIVDEASRSAQDVMNSLEQVRSSTSETKSAAEEIAGAAKELVSQAENLNSNVGNFLDEISAA